MIDLLTDLKISVYPLEIMGVLYSLLSRFFYIRKKRTNRSEKDVTKCVPLRKTSNSRALVNNIQIQSVGNITIGDRGTITNEQSKQRKEKRKQASVATDDRSLFHEETQISKNTTFVNKITIHCAEIVVVGNRNELQVISNNDKVSTSDYHPAYK